MSIKQISLFSFLTFFFLQAWGQSNINITNGAAESVLNGNYDSQNYTASEVIDNPQFIVCDLQQQVDPDTLLATLDKLGSFYTRHTLSDTSSNTKGIGAARRWIYKKFQQYSNRNDNRLIPAFMGFDKNMLFSCGGVHHLKNVFSVLPGRDTSQPIIVYMAHMDSRCVRPCDDTCRAPGIDDNGSGTALVMELARVMSKYTYDHTMVFLLTTGEEIGLYGAKAFAKYLKDTNIQVKAGFNNDTDGGIICGNSSSVPSCPYAGHIDSTHLRIFSRGTNFSRNKSLARWIKLANNEALNPSTQVPMNIEVRFREDRQGRGGDQTAFNDRGFTAVRLTEANEHGNGAPDGNNDGQIDSNYISHQHTYRDVLGKDTNGDGKIDSFFVNARYLKRNTVINGLAGTFAGLGPPAPTFTLSSDGSGMEINITDQTQYKHYRVGVRTDTTLFEKVYTFKDSLNFKLPSLQNGQKYYVSVAAVDQYGIESLFAPEQMDTAQTTTPDQPSDAGKVRFTCDTILSSVNPPALSKDQSRFELLPAYPNPANGKTTIGIKLHTATTYQKVYLVFTNLQGKTVLRKELDNLHKGLNTYHFDLSNLSTRLLQCSLVVDGEVVGTRKFIITK